MIIATAPAACVEQAATSRSRSETTVTSAGQSIPKAGSSKRTPEAAVRLVVLRGEVPQLRHCPPATGSRARTPRARSSIVVARRAELDPDPSAERRRRRAKIDCDVPDSAGRAADELDLRKRRSLEVETAERPRADAEADVLLHERRSRRRALRTHVCTTNARRIPARPPVARARRRRPREAPSPRRSCRNQSQLSAHECLGNTFRDQLILEYEIPKVDRGPGHAERRRHGSRSRVRARARVWPPRVGARASAEPDPRVRRDPIALEHAPPVHERRLWLEPGEEVGYLAVLRPSA